MQEDAQASADVKAAERPKPVDEPEENEEAQAAADMNAGKGTKQDDKPEEKKDLGAWTALEEEGDEEDLEEEEEDEDDLEDEEEEESEESLDGNSDSEEGANDIWRTLWPPASESRRITATATSQANLEISCSVKRFHESDDERINRNPQANVKRTFAKHDVPKVYISRSVRDWHCSRPRCSGGNICRSPSLTI